MATHATDSSCPQARRTYTRRNENARRYRDPRWRRMLAEHAHIPTAACAVCHRKHGQPVLDKFGNEQETKSGKIKKVTLTINHLERLDYLDDDAFFTWNEKKRVECTLCNLLFEKGMKPCPTCLEKGIYKPIRWHDEECIGCYLEKHPEIKAKMEEKRARREQEIRQYNANRAKRQREAKVKHPCSHRLTAQRCSLGGGCEFSPTKAPRNCKRGFKLKKKGR